MGEDVKRSRMFRRNMDFKFVECGDMVHGNWSQVCPFDISANLLDPFDCFDIRRQELNQRLMITGKFLSCPVEPRRHLSFPSSVSTTRRKSSLWVFTHLH